MIYISENIGKPSKEEIEETMREIRRLRKKRVISGGPAGDEANEKRDRKADDLSRGLRDLGRENQG